MNLSSFAASLLFAQIYLQLSSPVMFAFGRLNPGLWFTGYQKI